MRETTSTRGFILVAGVALGATAGIITSLRNYVRREVRRRGYPSWQTCRCDFKTQASIFQVWHSQHERQGETIVAQEWGTLLVNPPQWLRRFLHTSSQALATLNPQGRYLERVTLTPQEAHRFALLLQAALSNEEPMLENAHIVWRREILHAPRSIVDTCLRRLYPTHIPQERVTDAQALPALWDPHTDLPVPTEGPLLEMPIGTRIDYIGWTPSQISYCTMRSANVGA